MRTLFLNPPSFRGFDGGAGSRYQAKREIRSFWYPTWLAQAAALVNDSRVLDAPANDISILDAVAIACEFDLVIIYTSTPSFSNDSSTAALIKKRRPDILIGMVGPHVSVLASESLEAAKAVDFMARKEFDLTIKRIASGEHYSKVAGVSWRHADRICHNGEPELINDLDSLPFVIDVYKRDLNIENYYIGYLEHPYISLYTGRGCPGMCTFCLWPQTMTGHHYRVRTPSSVLNEIELAKSYFPQAKELFIDDDTFTADPERAIRIAEGLSELGIPWSTSSRTNISFETIKSLKENRLRLLMVGFESGSDDILRLAKKGANTDMARKFIANCKALGIAVHGTFMLGLPGETKETIQQTIKFANEIAPDTIQVSIASPYPGTEFYDQAIENGWLKKADLVSKDGAQQCVISYDNLTSQEIMQSVDEFYRKFYFRPRVIFDMSKEMITDFDVCRRRLREGREFISFLRKSNEADNQPRYTLASVIENGGPGFCQFAITNICNAKCKFCNFGNGQSDDQLRINVNFDDGCLALDILSTNGVRYIAFVGGEPTVHPQLAELIGYASKLGMTTMISTNGWLLTDDRIEEYARMGLDIAIISIDASDENVHESNRGIKGLCDRIKQANGHLKRLGIESTASATLSRLLGDMQALPDFLKSMGFDQVTFSYPMTELYSGYQGFSDSGLVSMSIGEMFVGFERIIGLKKKIKVLNPTESLRDMQRFILKEPQRYPCYAGYKSFHLDWNFNLFRCHYWPTPICSIWEFDQTKMINDHCTKCLIDCYRDSSVMQHLGVGISNAASHVRHLRPDLALRELFSRRMIGSAKSVMENSDWIRHMKRRRR